MIERIMRHVKKDLIDATSGQLTARRMRSEHNGTVAQADRWEHELAEDVTA